MIDSRWEKEVMERGDRQELDQPSAGINILQVWIILIYHRN